MHYAVACLWSTEEPILYALARSAGPASYTFGWRARRGLRIVTSADGTEFLQLRRSSVDGDVVVSREQASTDARAKGGSWRVPGDRQHVELRIVLDHSVAEVFTSDGDALTLRFYPVGTADWQLHVVGGGAVHLRAWELRALVWTT